jgi:hypothetical protein
MIARRFLSLSVTALLAATAGTGAHAGFVDAQGREWLQVKAFKGVAWATVDAACPNDGVTPCTGTVMGVNLDGYVWATKEQVQELFAEFAPEMASAESLGGPAYTLPALGFFGSFQPTFEYYTTFGGYNYISGWTSTESDGMAFIPEASAQYPVFDGYFSVAAMVDVTIASQFRGAWLFKPAPVVCDADLDGSGAVDAADLAVVLGAWGTRGPNTADLDASGTVDGQDLAILLGAWGDC